MAAIGEVAGNRQIGGGELPFRFGRQPLPGPFGEGVGLIKADMADRLGRVRAGGARKG